FGRTGMLVPPIAVGCAEIGSMPDSFAYTVSEEDALATVRAFLSSPINYIDTAASYNDGESERRIGKVLRELGGLPPDTIVQTKAGCDRIVKDFSRETVQRRFERSLDLLGLDHVHTVFLHDAEQTTFEHCMAPGGVVEMLLDYRDQGVVDNVGVASGPIDLSLRYVETGVFDCLLTHNRYTLLNRTADPAQREAKRRRMTVLNAAPYGSGLLAKGPDVYPRYSYAPAPPEMLEVTRQIAAACERCGVPLPAAALQFSMLDPNVDVTIVGMSKPERVQQTIEYATIPIPQALWDELATFPTFGDE
ncbi:MAG: aldo/keto reductase, partial [Chloroflexota bacterium]|nr:aldo/keto reductase [Chloroflexota bacterium]